MRSGEYRINNYSLLRVSDRGNTKQMYVFDDNTQRQYFTDMQMTVWGIGEYQMMINQVFNNPYIHTPTDLPITTRVIRGELLLGLSESAVTEDTMGICIVICDTPNGNVLYSQIIPFEDIAINTDQTIIDGMFWTNKIEIEFPMTDTAHVGVQLIGWQDILSNGFILKYPTSLVPLVTDAPAPEYIQVRATFTDYMFLVCDLVTSENKTIQKSLLDYFGILTDTTVDIEYVITYGATDERKSIRVSNETDKYLPITIGIPTDNQNMTIDINCDIHVDGKLMRRSTAINVDMGPVLQSITTNITHPETIIPITVENKTIVNQQIIDTKESVKIIPVYQPIFAEMIRDDFYFESKYVRFDKLTKPGSLYIYSISDDTLITAFSSITLSDNSIVFDLASTDVTFIDEKYSYRLFDDARRLVGDGTMLIRK